LAPLVLFYGRPETTDGATAPRALVYLDVFPGGRVSP